MFDAPSTGEGEPGGNKSSPAEPRAATTPSALPTSPMAIAGVAGAIVIGAIAVLVALAGSGGQVIDAPDKGLAGANEQQLLAGAGDLVVDVTGAVTAPGVYHLPAGSRVGDAIDAAGGFSPRVDADAVAAALNLAETVRDGSQVHVPSRDDAPATGNGGGPGGVGSGGAGGLTNLNTASLSELDALPGIGPATATKIIESRSTPFTSVDDLRERKLVGEKTFDKLKSLVTVD